MQESVKLREDPVLMPTKSTNRTDSGEGMSLDVRQSQSALHIAGRSEKGRFSSKSAFEEAPHSSGEESANNMSADQVLENQSPHAARSASRGDSSSERLWPQAPMEAGSGIGSEEAGELILS